MTHHPTITSETSSSASLPLDAPFDSIESLTTSFAATVVPTLETTTVTEVALGHHRNQQYSITAMTTSSGAVAERYTYTAYGQPTILNASGTVLTNSAVGNRYTYTGREWDETIGLHHFRARWMSPLAGRFLGRDPIGYEGTPWELYEFVYSKPLVFADPDGLAGSICGSPYPWGIYPISLPKILPGVGRPNSKTLLGFNRGCFLNCRAKEDRVTGSAPMLPPGVVVPIGPSGGNNTTQNFPTNPPSKVGGGGCQPCVVVVIKCGTTVTVFHFLAGIDDPIETLRPYDWSGCKTMVCGGMTKGSQIALRIVQLMRFAIKEYL